MSARGQHTPLRRVILVLVTAGFVLAGALPAAAAPSWSIAPSASPPAPAGALSGISCPTITSCFAVGTIGSIGGVTRVIERWNGSAWSVLPPPAGTSGDLESVSCVSATECFAVGATVPPLNGAKPVTEHWNGTAWSVVAVPDPAPGKQSILRSVSCVSATFCVAVGNVVSGSSPGFVAHWNGTQWSLFGAPPSARLKGVSCVSATFCIAVGQSSSGGFLLTRVLKWDGVQWSVQVSANPSGITGAILNAVACRSASMCFAVGEADYQSSPTARTLTERWNGTSWSVVASPNEAGVEKTLLLGVSCPSTTLCFATGAGGGNHALIERWNGSVWSIAPNAPATTGVYFDVSCPTTTNCAAVGAANIMRYDGTSWSTAPLPVGSSYSGLAGVGCFGATVCFAVGTAVSATGVPGGLIERWTGSAWTTVASPPLPGTAPRLTEVACGSSTSCFAVGVVSEQKSVIERWNGTAWTLSTHPVGAGATRSFLTGVSCTSATFCMAVGQAYFETFPSVAPLAQRWNGTNWSIVPAPGPNGSGDSLLHDVSCISATDCTAVGRSISSTLIQHWNGSAWSIVPSPNPGTSRSLTAVSCANASNCFAVGELSTTGSDLVPLALRWNGATWSMTATPALSTFGRFSGVKCLTATSCVAVGGVGTATLIETWNGASWSLAASPNPTAATQSSLSDVSCPSATSCHAVGDFYRRPDFAFRYTLAERLS